MHYLGCSTRRTERRSRGVRGCTLRLGKFLIVNLRNAVMHPKNILREVPEL